MIISKDWEKVSKTNQWQYHKEENWEQFVWKNEMWKRYLHRNSRDAEKITNRVRTGESILLLRILHKNSTLLFSEGRSISSFLSPQKSIPKVESIYSTYIFKNVCCLNSFFLYVVNGNAYKIKFTVNIFIMKWKLGKDAPEEFGLPIYKTQHSQILINYIVYILSNSNWSSKILHRSLSDLTLLTKEYIRM